MATAAAYGPGKDLTADQDVRSSTKSLETTAGGEYKKKGCCSRCLTCFFCYLPWIPILLCAISLAAAIVSLTTVNSAASETKKLMDMLGFGQQGFATRVLKTVPLAVWISLIVMAATVLAIFLLAILRSNQRAIHRGVYTGGCCEQPCCYWGLIFPAWIMTAIWWALLVLVVVLLMALTVWLVAALVIHYASDFAIKEGSTISGKVNGATAKLMNDFQTFMDQQNKTMQVVLGKNPILQQQWNQVTQPIANIDWAPAGCADGCLDVSLFGDAFGSKKCVCAQKELGPLKDDAKKIASIVFVALISTCILYLSASLLLVNLTQGNTNAYRDKEELKRLKREYKAQKGTQFLQSPDVEQA